MSEFINIEVLKDEEGERIDKFLLVKLKDFTRSRIQTMIADGLVLTNKKVLNKNYRVKYGDKISIEIKEPKVLDIEPENIELDIRYEDEDLLVVNKPKGMVVHPAPGHYSKTLVNALLYYCGGSLSAINGVIRPGIVHRIDKDTSGLLIVAKNDFAHKALAEKIKEHKFKREYLAIVYGNIKNDSGVISEPIGRDPKDRKKMAVVKTSSKNAVTHYFVEQRYNGFTKVSLRLETGRTHQIRVHMAYIGYPVAGDSVYGPKKVISELEGQCLHAKLIGFNHPRDGRCIEIEVYPPEQFINFENSLLK